MPRSDKEQDRIYSKEYERKRRLHHPEKYLWRSAKQRARKKGLDFDIEVSDIIIPQFCPLLNIPIQHIVGNGVGRNPNAPSLDRLQNHLGYVKGNILVVSWRANFIKGDATIEEFRLLLTNWEAINKQI